MTASSSKKANENPTAIELLTEDHRHVEALFEKFEKASGGATQAKLVRQICDELTIHAMVEEQIFYPSLRGKIEDDMLDEAYVEHDSLKVLIRDLLQGNPDDEFFKAKVTVLKEQVEHHVKEEERSRDSIFAKARSADVDLKELGREMMENRKALLLKAESGELPPPTMCTTSIAA